MVNKYDPDQGKADVFICSEVLIKRSRTTGTKIEAKYSDVNGGKPLLAKF
ncbi:hypothetical protein [Salinimicrobium oceani]|uniref:Uncharacterized protein n=1 Tax=Salinimicrobium oceani TaxID=2722702 RepID=A0ABX1CVL0_9FLAO|nr:hypothetical protein [Salinimicrobium oceani]NJW51945.1 hypothetical protein [Salinimicrobium oceani]